MIVQHSYFGTVKYYDSKFKLKLILKLNIHTKMGFLVLIFVIWYEAHTTVVSLVFALQYKQ